jgi:hypothetical protein
MTPRTRQRSRQMSAPSHIRSTAEFHHTTRLPPDTFGSATLKPVEPVLTVPRAAAVTDELKVLQTEADDLMGSGRLMPHTNRCYIQRFDRFRQWCEKRSLASLPASPATIVLFLTDKGRSTKIGTVRGYRAAIRDAHEKFGCALPYPTDHVTVRKVIAGLATRHAVSGKSTRKAHPFSADELVLLSTSIVTMNFEYYRRDEFAGGKLTKEQRQLWLHATRLRFHSMLLAAWHGCRRVDELVRAERSWISRDTECVLFTPDRQKGRATGFVSVLSSTDNPLLCPVRALDTWLALVDQSTESNPESLWPEPVLLKGRLMFIDGVAHQREAMALAGAGARGTRTDLELEDFLESRSLAAAVSRFRHQVKAVSLAAGIDAGPDRFIGCHSMRRGMVTTLRGADVGLVEIAARVTGHRDLQTLSGYDDYVPADHPVSRLGL